MKPPCKKDCQNRSGTCHAECVAYLDFVAWCAERRKQERKENKVYAYIKDAVQSSKSRSRDWKGKS